MRVVRRASVVFSLVLIVAIAVGYVGRRSEVAEVRDERLTRAADIGAVRVDALVDATTVAAISATTPESAVQAVRRTYPSVSACAGTGTITVCDGPLVSDLAASSLEPQDRRPSVVTHDDGVVITADGEYIALQVISSVDVATEGVDDISTYATTLQPNSGVGSIIEVDGTRQTSAAALAAPGTYVIAETSAALRLPGNEEWFYLIVASLAVVLFFLAGATLIVEQRSLRERATLDALTQLPNRSEFERRANEMMASADRFGHQVCLLLFDLNEFKQVNDTYGHHVGDELLRVVGRRLAGAVRDGDLVARWGGDEFVALMPGMSSEEMGVRRARQIAELVSGRTRVDGVPEALRVRVSVGVALWPSHADELDTLLEAADEAMYRAKRDGTTTAIAHARPVDSVTSTPFTPTV